MIEEEYEIIPTSPLRRLEKRISKLEETSQSSQINKLIEQIIELIKSNQRIIDDVVKSDSELRNEISKLPGKIDALLSMMKEFVEMLKASATEESTAEVSKEIVEPMVKKIDELIEQNRQNLEASKAILTNLSAIDNRLKRLYMQYSSTVR